jgi:hypothetical protein
VFRCHLAGCEGPLDAFDEVGIHILEHRLHAIVMESQQPIAHE